MDGSAHPLSAEQLDELRGEILRQLERLERSMLVTDERLRPVELDPTAVGRLSRIDELQNQALAHNLREREQIKLAGLVDALRSLEAGTYGACTECGTGIPFDRLLVFPESPTCVDCSA
ncbi:MAG: TraR/DksA C4-type zinc finger protein [Gemmatimonadota bacterium]|nr:TraR/DksA C4-type zinc finger protein [Gemmatimonadota bacterium]